MNECRRNMHVRNLNESSEHVRLAKHDKQSNMPNRTARHSVSRCHTLRRTGFSVYVCTLLMAVFQTVVCTSPNELRRDSSTAKLGIRREKSTVDLNDLATPGEKPDTPVTQKCLPIFRANSFVGTTPLIDPKDLSAFDPRNPDQGSLPTRRKSFTLAPPRRETSRADMSDLAPPRPNMSHLPTPTLQAKHKEPIQKTADVALAAKDLKETIRKIDGIVAGQVSSEEEEHWKSRIVYTGEVLGVGGFSVVHGAKDTMTGLEYAVKVVNIPPDNACFVRRLIREVGLLKELDHPNIVKLHKCLETSDRCQLFMERCQGGELLGLMEHIEFSHDGVRWLRFDHVNGGEPVEFTEVDIIYILHQVLEAVKFCHERNIVHRDLKMENLLLVEPWQTGERRIKLADFGFATRLEPSERLTSACGSPHYCSPEVLNGGKKGGALGYRTECDVWAIGIIAYSLLCCQYPFDGETDAEVVNAVAKGQFTFGDHVKLSGDAQDFVRSLIVVDMKQRFTVQHALAHPWIRKNVEAGIADAAARSEAHAVLHAAALSKETVKATGGGGGLLLAKDQVKLLEQ